MAVKKLTTGEQNLCVEMGVDPAKLFDPATTQRSNRFTGATAPMNESVAKLHDKFFGMVSAYERGQKVNVAKMDRVKYLVLKANSEAYYNLID